MQRIFLLLIIAIVATSCSKDSNNPVRPNEGKIEISEISSTDVYAGDTLTLTLSGDFQLDSTVIAWFGEYSSSLARINNSEQYRVHVPKRITADSIVLKSGNSILCSKKFSLNVIQFVDQSISGFIGDTLNIELSNYRISADDSVKLYLNDVLIKSQAADKDGFIKLKITESMTNGSLRAVSYGRQSYSIEFRNLGLRSYVITGTDKQSYYPWETISIYVQNISRDPVKVFIDGVECYINSIDYSILVNGGYKITTFVPKNISNGVIVVEQNGVQSNQFPIQIRQLPEQSFDLSAYTKIYIPLFGIRSSFTYSVESGTGNYLIAVSQYCRAVISPVGELISFSYSLGPDIRTEVKNLTFPSTKWTSRVPFIKYDSCIVFREPKFECADFSIGSIFYDDKGNVIGSNVISGTTWLDLIFEQ